MRAVSSALLFVLLAACAADSTMPISNASKLPVGGSTLRLVVTATTAQLEPGARDTLQVVLTNDGPSAVVLHFGSGCHVLPYLRNGAGDVLLPSGGGWTCTAALSTLSLGAGQSLSQVFLWDGSDAFASEMPTRRLPAGTYYFSAEVAANEGHMIAGPLAITVR